MPGRYSFRRHRSHSTEPLLRRERGGDGPLLPTHRPLPMAPITARRVTQMSIQLKRLLEAVIPTEIKISTLTKPDSPVLTKKVLSLIREVCSGDERSALVYCLLVAMDWFMKQAEIELYDCELNRIRAAACENAAKRIIESEEDEDFMMQEMLLRKFQFYRGKHLSRSANALERAIDLHALTVVSSSGYQKCINYLWRGWIIQDPDDGTKFIAYNHTADTDFWVHFDHDRLRAPIYQNTFQIFISFVFLALYTIVINTLNPGGELDVIEGFLYFFTLAYTFDELAKIFKVGLDYISFWNVFNLSLYGLLIVSFVFRIIALAWDKGSPERYDNQVLSYNFLAFTAPMIWMRMLLYLDSIQFFGTMLLVLKVMMKESLIFFSLLIIVLVGFLQAFIGLDNSDNRSDATTFILRSMIGAVLGGPDLNSFDNFAHPFGMVLYHVFTFIVIVILLNILIALYNQAYTDIMENAEEEFMALYSHKTIQFVRAPDENVFIPPLNLIEIFCLIIPLEWWMPKRTYAYINDAVMKVLYSPFMLLIAAWEIHLAKRVQKNRKIGEADDDVRHEWEMISEEEQDLFNDWTAKCAKVIPDIDLDKPTQEILKLKDELRGKLDELDRKLHSTVVLVPGSGSSGSAAENDG